MAKICNDDHGFDGYWCSREKGHDGPCALRDYGEEPDPITESLAMAESLILNFIDTSKEYTGSLEIALERIRQARYSMYQQYQTPPMGGAPQQEFIQ